MPNHSWKCTACGTIKPPLTTVCRDCNNPGESERYVSDSPTKPCIAQPQMDESAQSVFAKQVTAPENDMLIARIVAAVCTLMLATAGYMVVDSEYFWGKTKYGREVELFGTRATGMGVLLLSFAVILPAYFTNRKVAIVLWTLGILGALVATWLTFFNCC